ncbi:MAG: hypothetical protein ACRC5H_03185, partial [Treponemataceae bacterium]
MKIKTALCILFIGVISLVPLFSQITSLPIIHLRTIKKAYPEVVIQNEFDTILNDWKITIRNN